MKVNRSKLAAIIYTHCIVNIKADGEILKYRYLPNPDDPEFGVWFCNGENTGMQATALIKYLIAKYKDISVVYKRQF